ncbi:SDR family oxidoreductase [Acidovorax lacteus]|uniref:SDR family oxidoreductase n=1 Tax=Acidovorax lacteus TaxID=1924988 RepID=A0ABP8KVI7_9BURK
MAERFTVIGATGYIGSRLVRHLQALGHTVWAPSRGDAALLEQPLAHVLYCAGLTGDFRTRPFDTVEAHVGLLARVLQCAQFDSLLYLSSTRVYMGAASTHEDAALSVVPGDPSYLYNLSKLTGESLCHASGRPGVRVARLSNVVGPGMDVDSGNLVADLIQQARSTGRVELRSDPASAKDYIHLEDVVNGLVRIALQGRHAVYNLASGVQTSHADWLGWLGRQTGCTVHVAPDAPLQSFPPINVSRLLHEWPGAIQHSLWDPLLVSAFQPQE